MTETPNQSGAAANGSAVAWLGVVRPCFHITLLMKDSSSDDDMEQIDARSNDLIREFLEHKQQTKARHPEADDARVFEAWAIQKISGLQHSVMHLAAHLRELQDRFKT